MNRKSIASAVAALLIAGFVGTGYAESDPHSLPTSITVNNNFGLVFNPPVTSINFGAVNTGVETLPQTVSIEARSNHGMAWNVALQANPLTHTDGTTQIPGANFQYFHTFDHLDANEIPAAGTPAPVPTVETAVFEAGPALYTTQFAGFGLGFKVIVGPSQKVGDYSTVVNIRMVDGF